MSTFDKILHVIGLAAGGLVAVSATGGIAMPAWLVAVAAVVAPIASGTAATWRKPPPPPTGNEPPKPGA